MFLDQNSISEIQIDHTSRCNLACPQCARTEDGWSQIEANKNLDLNLDDYKILLEPFKENTLKVFHCGNFGEAIASPTFDETFDYTLSKSPRNITIATNGSLKSPSWWKELAIKGGGNLNVTFALDGLEDTNHIYRVNSSWSKIMDNAQSFIDAGGKARWDFIEFEHNYHQIEEAEKLATDMGFKRFNVKYTARFANRGIKSELNKKNQLVADTAKNKNQSDVAAIKKEYKSFDEYTQKTSISCKYQKENKVFVDMKMRLWPCCWFGAPSYLSKNKQTESFKYLEKIYGSDFNCLRTHGWNVLEHEFYATYLKKSWESPDSRYKRIYTCGRTCGEKFEFSSGYGKNTSVQILTPSTPKKPLNL